MFKDRLKELREREGLTQKELGEKIFVSRSAICKWEMGNGIPSDINLQALCVFFNVEEDWLLDRKDLKQTVNMYKLQIKNSVMSVICIIVPLILCLVSSIGIFTYGKSGEYIFLIYIRPRSIFYYLKEWSVAPLLIWITTMVFSKLQIRQNTIERKAILNLKIKMGLLVLSLLVFIVALVVSNSLANAENFWL